MIDRAGLVAEMAALLEEAVRAEGEETDLKPSSASPLVGGEAILSSLALVSYIMDVESILSDDYDLDVTLVNESALSRAKSPFRSVDALADYVLELAAGEGASAEVGKQDTSTTGC